MMRRIVAVLLTLSLPLQAQAAVLMSFSEQGIEASSSAAAPQHEVGHCQHAVDAGDDGSPAGRGDSCDRCALCHLVGPTPLAQALPALPPARDYALPAGEGHVSHIPEAPQRPPRQV